MSVTTTADEKLTSAKEHIACAINDLHVFLDKDTWGNCDWDKEYKEKVEKCYIKLRKLKDKL